LLEDNVQNYSQGKQLQKTPISFLFFSHFLAHPHESSQANKYPEPGAVLLNVFHKNVKPNHYYSKLERPLNEQKSDVFLHKKNPRKSQGEKCKRQRPVSVRKQEYHKIEEDKEKERPEADGA